MVYRISSHWDARMSVLDRGTYDTLDAALVDVRRVGPDELVVEPSDGGWLVYRDQEESDRDADGAAHNAIAQVTMHSR